jgi:hypothetical protein
MATTTATPTATPTAAEAAPIRITPANIGRAIFRIVGTAPLMTAKFSSRIKANLIKEREEGKRPGARPVREKADYQQAGMEAAYRDADGWYGVHAAAFRAAMISACRLVGLKMTIAKLSIFVDADGYDAEEGTPLTRITVGDPEIRVMPVRNQTGVMDLRARPVWRPGWEMQVRINWDRDQYNLTEITNLLGRVGQQVGIGEGRPDSRESAGLGYGLFLVVEVSELERAEPTVTRAAD